MPQAIKTYVRIIERINRVIGRATMYMVFAMMGILLYSSFMKTVFLPPLWTLEVSQFMMVAYFLLGGAYSMQLDSHVRMDLAYSHWSPKTRAVMDTVTITFLIFFVAMLLYGGYSSTEYALQYGERSYSSWRPYMAPIKIIMTFGIFMMLLQSIASFFKHLAEARGETLS